jgi:hypothetical protein
LAVWGYAGQTSALFDKPKFNKKSGRIEMQVNPLTRFAYFSELTDAELFDTAGKRLERHRQVTQMDVAHLNAGSYFLRLNGRDVHKLVLQ